MDTRTLEAHFAKMGARLKVTTSTLGRPAPAAARTGPVVLDIRRDQAGEFFEIRGRDGAAELAVLDLQPRDRHLLLMVREQGEKRKFLCGHDERHWFVAAVPEGAHATSVQKAKDALKPAEVRRAELRQHVKPRHRDRRRNAAFVRQGEWFFVPAPEVSIDPRMVLRNEPLSRGRGKPHIAESCHRTGGESVYVCLNYPAGLSGRQYERLLRQKPEARGWNWRVMLRNPEVYVRGRVRHDDHRTIVLNGWHRVFMNTENQARAMRSVAFLD